MRNLMKPLFLMMILAQSFFVVAATPSKGEAAQAQRVPTRSDMNIERIKARLPKKLQNPEPYTYQQQEQRNQAAQVHARHAALTSAALHMARKPSYSTVIMWVSGVLANDLLEKAEAKQREEATCSVESTSDTLLTAVDENPVSP